MARKPDKLLVLGLDAALPDLLRRFSEEGAIPHLRSLMDRGVFSRAITTFPPLTAAAWSAIVTGAATGSTGVPSLMVHFPGEPLDRWHTSFDRRVQLAETLWEAGLRAGRVPALINWPVTWPLGLERGVQVAAALNPPFRFFYMPLFDIASSSFFATRRYPCNQVPGRMVVVQPRPASDWAGLEDSRLPPLEFTIEVPPTYARGPRYRVAVVARSESGYDEVVVSPVPDVRAAVARLRPGELSPWVYGTFETGGQVRRGRFRFQLVALSPDGQDVRLYVTAVNTAEPYTVPPELTTEVEKAAGPYMEVDDPWAFMDGWIPLEAFLAQLTAHNEWWQRATSYILRTQPWDLAFSWVGTIDHIQHVLYGGIEPRARTYDPDTADRWWAAIRRVYQEVDAGVGEILKCVDPDRTVILAVSDHGFTHLDFFPFIKYALAEAGLIHFTLDPETGQMQVDWSRTKCYPLEPGHAHIFINLKGRDPDGCVDPADYERVQDQIIDALMRLKDPVTGETVVAVAVRKQDARILGIHPGPGFDRIGDVLYAWKPGYMANPYVYRAAVKYFDGTERITVNRELFEASRLLHNFTGAHLTLPTVPEMHAAVILAGPGIRHVWPDQPIDLVDLAPTLAPLLGIPTPRHAEGRVRPELLEP
ncbi:MAG: alkaline phosphatase family protein [Armatimonadota bacterium]|nr:alkaline phosphatase family protein [Armatimonadota bacterium]MDR5676766.1 alkaline phosphatase family protein [Armatimonadota bacterium]MDR5688707.1 alkaline phosphatase family protein [Armatimonadota bacterium]MDR7390259.1 alkaline phosphatase family protein [Armatimonadota bacterium]MDR7390872.1 alkaline phosphatase family protein [Armatimonadota bacterium]